MDETQFTVTYATTAGCVVSVYTATGVCIDPDAAPPSVGDTLPDLPKVIDLPEVLDWLREQDAERLFYPGDSRRCVVACYVREHFKLNYPITTGRDGTDVIFERTQGRIHHTWRLRDFIAAFDSFIPSRVVCGWYCTTRDEVLALLDQPSDDQAYTVSIEDCPLTLSDVPLHGVSGDLVLELSAKRRAQETVPA